MLVSYKLKDNILIALLFFTCFKFQLQFKFVQKNSILTYFFYFEFLLLLLVRVVF